MLFQFVRGLSILSLARKQLSLLPHRCGCLFCVHVARRNPKRLLAFGVDDSIACCFSSSTFPTAAIAVALVLRAKATVGRLVILFLCSAFFLQRLGVTPASDPLVPSRC